MIGQEASIFAKEYDLGGRHFYIVCQKVLFWFALPPHNQLIILSSNLIMLFLFSLLNQTISGKVLEFL